ncbi:MAG TPA: phosphatase PAP2 family protein [Candidatus Nanoarchaeia archaeon]|nr:phosphatase PAP2 family protein [Candidatus Nanoarchaeia archaeon]
MIRKKEFVITFIFFALALISYLFLDKVGPFTGNPFLDAAMQLVTAIGDFVSIFVIGVLLVVYAFLWKKKVLQKQSLFFIFAYLVNSLLILILKTSIGRERPILGIEDTASFPSGHASEGIFTAKIFGTWYPKFRIALYTFAALSAFSRIYFGLHYLSDIFAGFGISYLTATIFLVLYERYVMKTRQKSS